MKYLEIFIFFFVAINLSIVQCSRNFYYEKGKVSVLSQCPGKYCGRTYLENGSWSSCGACEKGLRKNSSGACDICSENPSSYDWLYLGFMFFLPVVYHLVVIDIFAENEFSKKVLILSGISILEALISAAITLLIMEPKGSLSLNSCHVRSLADWYPILHNPNPNYEGKLYCTQEAVYPLYSIVFVFYTLCLISMIFVRSWLSSRFLGKQGTAAIYSALYFFPIVICLHGLLGGLIYYSFAYIIIGVSLVSNAAYFASHENQNMRQLFLQTVTKGRNVVVLIGHWFFHSYGIIAATHLEYPFLLFFIPLPSIFYIFTSKFTKPALFS